MMALLWLTLVLSFITPAYAADAPACFPLSSDHILGRDVSRFIPELASLAVIAPEAELGMSPAAGMVRVFSAVQLRQWAEKYGVHANLQTPVCFSWPLHYLSQPMLTEAMRKSLTGQQVELTVTDQSHFPVPEGELTFPLQGFSGESDKPALWSGFVTYGSRRRFTTWARVRITVHEKHI